MADQQISSWTTYVPQACTKCGNRAMAKETICSDCFFEDEAKINSRIPNYDCDICHKHRFGWGNSMIPLGIGRCCDGCNDRVVRARIEQLFKKDR